MPINYQNGKVYAIRSHQTDKIYIGSTTQSLARRFAVHKNDKKRGGKKCSTSKEMFQYDDCYIELLENYPCNSKEELLRKEGQLIRENDCVNRCIAGRTPKEWAQDNKEAVSVKNKKYRENNKEALAQKSKEYYKKNKEAKIVKTKEYRDTHKQEISEKRKVKMTCECGSIFRKNDKPRHLRSTKHQDYLKSLENQ